MTARRFEGKNVIVTGAGQGIGLAIAERFAGEGADVMLIGRRREPLEALVARIEAAGGAAWLHPADVSDSAAVDAAVAAAHGALGSDRRARQQRGHRRGEGLPRDRGRELGRDPGHEPSRRVPDVAARRPRAGRSGRWRDRPHRLDRRVRGRRSLRELQRLQGRPARSQPDDGARARSARRPRQLRQPGLHPHRDDRGRRAARDDGVPRATASTASRCAASCARRRSRPPARSSPPRMRRRSRASTSRSTAASPPTGTSSNRSRPMASCRVAAGTWPAGGASCSRTTASGWSSCRTRERRSIRSSTSGREPTILFEAPWGLQPPGAPPLPGSGDDAFMWNYAGGWQELFPSVNEACAYRGRRIPFHGEVASLPWQHEVLDGGGSEARVRFWTQSRLTPFLVERVLRLRRGRGDARDRGDGASTSRPRTPTSSGAIIASSGRRSSSPAAGSRSLPARSSPRPSSGSPRRPGSSRAVASRGPWPRCARAGRSTSATSRAPRRGATTTST